jgi:hypothetical protein
MILYINKNGVKYSTTDSNLSGIPLGNNVNFRKKTENIEARFEFAFKTKGERDPNTNSVTKVSTKRL